MSSWNTVRLADVLRIDKTTVSPSDAQNKPYVGLEHITKNTGEIENGCKQSNADVKSTKFAFDQRHILYGKLRPNLNKVALPDFSGVCSTDIYPLLVDNDVADRRLICAILRSSDFVAYASSQVRGANLPRVNESVINNYEISLPTLNEQRRIASLLDKVSDLITLRKQQLEQLDLMVKSQFIEMFGKPLSAQSKWPIEYLGKLCDMKAGKFVSASEIKEKDEENQYPCYGGNGLRGYVCSYSHEGNYPLIGRQGALCGNVQYVEGKFYATEHAVVTKPIIEMNTYWLFYTLKELDLNRLSSGAAQPGLTVGKLNLVQIPYPPIKLQNQFSNFAKQVDKSKLEIQQGLKKLELQYNALMQRYFG
jgi:type I restriction enzyme S subunit